MSKQSQKAKIIIFEKDNGFAVQMEGDPVHLTAGLAVGIEHVAGSSQKFETMMQMIRKFHEKMAEEGVTAERISDEGIWKGTDYVS